MGWARGGLLFLMLLAASFAAVIEAGDWNATQTSWNASDAAAAKCGPGVQVYVCSGDAVKVVSSDASTFYKPDGSIVSCPNAAASQIGAECVQLLMPNRCSTEVKCETPVPQNQTTPVNKTENVSVGSATAPVVAPVKAASTPNDVSKKDIVIPAAAPSNADFSLDNLALVVLLLGAVSVGVLFTMFKNSISE